MKELLQPIVFVVMRRDPMDRMAGEVSAEVEVAVVRTAARPKCPLVKTVAHLHISTLPAKRYVCQGDSFIIQLATKDQPSQSAHMSHSTTVV